MTTNIHSSIAPRFRRAYAAVVRHIVSRGVLNCDFTALGVEIGGEHLEQLVIAGIAKKVGKTPQHRNIYRLVDDITKQTAEYYNRY